MSAILMVYKKIMTIFQKNATYQKLLFLVTLLMQNISIQKICKINELYNLLCIILSVSLSQPKWFSRGWSMQSRPFFFEILFDVSNELYDFLKNDTQNWFSACIHFQIVQFFMTGHFSNMNQNSGSSFEFS